MADTYFKKIISFLVALPLAFCLNGGSACINAGAETYDGLCSENIVWTLDTLTGVLDVAGTGEMSDYASGESPWYAYRACIKTVNIDSGVMGIGSFAFYDCTNIEVVNYSGTERRWQVVSVGEGNDCLLAAQINYLGNPIDKTRLNEITSNLYNLQIEKVTVLTYSGSAIGTTEKAKYDSDAIDEILEEVYAYDTTGLTAKDQAILDAFTDEIEAKISALKILIYDEYLKYAINEYDETEALVYTDESWDAYETSYNAAKQLVAPTQDEINNALANLVNSKAALDVLTCFRVKEGTDTVIDKENGFIYGLSDEGVTDLENYIEYAGGKLKYKLSSNGFGTGTVVNFVVDGVTLESYVIIIFGDITGDGVITSYDCDTLKSIVNGETTVSENSAVYWAADVNSDGELNTYDLAVLCACVNSDIEIVQTRKSDVSEDTSGTYEISEAEARVTTVLSQNKADTDDVVTVEVRIETNYPVGVVQLPVLYDKTCFELVNFSYGKSYLKFDSDSSLVQGSYVLNGNAGITKGFEKTSDDDEWNTDVAKSQYGYAWITATYDSSVNSENPELVIPQGEVFVTFRLRAKNTIENTSECVFISPDWVLTNEVQGGAFTIGFSSSEDNKNPLTFCPNGIKYSLETVSDILAEEVKLNFSEIILTKENPTVQLVATVLPENAADKTVTWSSDNEFVATVDSKGMVTFVKEGTATITVKTSQGQKATCTVTALHICSSSTLKSVSSKEPVGCNEGGNIQYYKCSCGKLYFDSEAITETTLEDVAIAPLNHPEDMVTKFEAVDPTHTDAGNIAYWLCAACKSKFSDAECTQTVDTVTLPATGHDNFNEIDWMTDDEKHWKECSCGYRKYEVSHYFLLVIDVEPTCTGTGIKHKECETCGMVIEENTVAETASHDIIKISRIEPTCLTQGNKEYYQCQACGKYFLSSLCTQEIDISETILESVEHYYSDWIVDVSATCVTSGMRHKTCVNGCEQSVYEVIDAMGHKYKETIVSATCTEDGYTEYECKNCGDKGVKDYVEATGHNYTSYSTPPTDTEDGYTTYVCINCGNQYTGEYTGSEGGVTVRCMVSSYGSVSVETKIELIQNGETKYVGLKAGTSAEVYIKGVLPGTYTMKVTKYGHISRVYEIVVGTENYKHSSVTLYLIGDVTGDGKVNTIDVARANAHAKGVGILTSDAYLCADVTGEGKVNTVDVAKINGHVKGVSPLW